MKICLCACVIFTTAVFRCRHSCGTDSLWSVHCTSGTLVACCSARPQPAQSLLSLLGATNVVSLSWSFAEMQVNSSSEPLVYKSQEVFWMKTCACRDGTLKKNNQTRWEWHHNTLTPSLHLVQFCHHLHKIICFVFVSCVHRGVVEGSGEGSAWCVVRLVMCKGNELCCEWVATQ